MKILKQIHVKIKPPNLTCRFIIDPKLLKLAENGDAHAQFQIGLQALSERRFGFAMAFFNLACRGGYQKAKGYLDITYREFHACAQKKLNTNEE